MLQLLSQVIHFKSCHINSHWSDFEQKKNTFRITKDYLDYTKLLNIFSFVRIEISYIHWFTFSHILCFAVVWQYFQLLNHIVIVLFLEFYFKHYIIKHWELLYGKLYVPPLSWKSLVNVIPLLWQNLKQTIRSICLFVKIRIQDVPNVCKIQINNLRNKVIRFWKDWQPKLRNRLCRKTF